MNGDVRSSTPESECGAGIPSSRTASSAQRAHRQAARCVGVSRHAAVETVMDSSEVRGLIEDALPDCQIRVEGEGCNFSVTVVSPAFAGLSTVRRHQQVLAALHQPLATGALHAISVKAYTPEEWRQRQQTDAAAPPAAS